MKQERKLGYPGENPLTTGFNKTGQAAWPAHGAEADQGETSHARERQAAARHSFAEGGVKPFVLLHSEPVLPVTHHT